MRLINNKPPMQMVQINYKGKAYLLDVDSLVEDCKQRECVMVDVNEAYEYNEYLNVEYAMNTNINNPVIVAKMDDGEFHVLDGNHRLFKAKQLGFDRIMAYVISDEYIKKYIIDEV